MEGKGGGSASFQFQEEDNQRLTTQEAGGPVGRAGGGKVVLKRKRTRTFPVFWFSPDVGWYPCPSVEAWRVDDVQYSNIDTYYLMNLNILLY